MVQEPDTFNNTNEGFTLRLASEVRENTEKLQNFNFYKDLSLRLLKALIENLGSLKSKTEVLQAIEEWTTDEVHGIKHSFDVFRKSLEVAKADKLRVDVYYLYVMSLVHDLSEFLPLINHQNGAVFTNERRFPDSKAERRYKEQKHPVLMAWILRFLLSKHEFQVPRTIIQDIKYHDIFWSKPSKAEMNRVGKLLSLEGRVLADADRLVDGGGTSIEQLVLFNITRNWKYASGREYFFRPLSAKDRLTWKKRSGGLYDAITVLMTEFSAPDHVFYFSLGKSINGKKKEMFKKVICHFIGEMYKKWIFMLNSVKPVNGVFALTCGLKGTDKLFEVWGNSMRDIVNKLFAEPVKGLEAKNGRAYYGYSIFLNGEWIDPSIIRYASVDILFRDILQAIAEFEVAFSEK